MNPVDTAEPVEDATATPAQDAAPERSTEPAPEISRRSMLRRPLTVALAAAGGVLLAGCDFTSATFDRRIHLLKRLTYGATPAARDRIVAIGEAAWLNEQLAPATLDTSAVNAKIGQL